MDEGVVMGLSFGVKKVELVGVHFSYSGFNEFRHRIARSCGFPDVYSGTENDFYSSGRWKEMNENHPMFPLLSHSDCEGDMNSEDCGKVGYHLKTLVEVWKAKLVKKYDHNLEHHIGKAEELSRVMIQCNENDETLVFC